MQCHSWSPHCQRIVLSNVSYGVESQGLCVKRRQNEVWHLLRHKDIEIFGVLETKLQGGKQRSLLQQFSDDWGVINSDTCLGDRDSIWLEYWRAQRSLQSILIRRHMHVLRMHGDIIFTLYWFMMIMRHITGYLYGLKSVICIVTMVTLSWLISGEFNKIFGTMSLIWAWCIQSVLGQRFQVCGNGYGWAGIASRFYKWSNFREFGVDSKMATS